MRVTVVGGSGGIFPFQELLKSIANHSKEQGIDWTFLFGTDQKALEKARRFVREQRLEHVRLSGFTSEIENYFLTSTAVITKPGGLSTGEVTACGVPLILCAPIPGQEEGNARVLCEAGAAIREDSPEKLVQRLPGLLKDRAGLRAMVRAAKKLLPQRSSEHVSREILGFVSQKKP